MAVNSLKTYTVTISPAENVYDESQVLKSIFESIYGMTHTGGQENSNTVHLTENEKLMKGDSI